MLKYNPSINTGRLKIVVSDGLLLTNIILIQENGRIIRETLLTGPQGVVKLETIWDGNRLITGEIYGPTGRFRHGAK